MPTKAISASWQSKAGRQFSGLRGTVYCATPPIGEAAFPLSSPMNQIVKLLPPTNILLGLEASSKKRVFEHAGLLFENHQGIARSTVYDALFAREKLGSTGLGQGIAIPHGRIKGLKEAVGGFLRLAEPVQFDSPDGKPVSLLFVLLVPEAATERHLQILSELAQMFSDRGFREQLTAAQDPAEIHSLFTHWQIDAPSDRRTAA